ncbi:MAG: LLM class flavin-dependent oxidoreductase [Chloroflexota bacterium]|nr:LLM class flavin-dependent oxidoreductase [Chloroflexota bacterium]
MKICWFHLMPYRHLPPDFEQKYRSVWVDPPSHLYDAEKAHVLYNEYLDELEHAAAVGFDGICVNEHHNNAYGIMPSPNLMAAALVRRTTEAAIVVMGNSLALYNPPLRVAEEFAMLDVASGGRLVAGFPTGTSMDTNFAYGANPATLRDRYHEAHDLIIRAWTEPDLFVFNGKYTQNRYVNIWPRPLQKPHPPVWVPGSGSVETWEWTSRMNYVYCYLSYSGYKHGTRVMKGFWREMENLGVDDNPYRAGFLQLVAVSETDAKAEEDYAPHIEYFFKKNLHVYPGFTEAPGYRSIKTLKKGVGSNLSRSHARKRTEMKWKDFVEEGYVIGGSPETVADRMREAVEGLRVGHLMVLLQIGSMPKDLTMQNTALFASEVMPKLRGMWSGYEDHWWPNPIANRAVPDPVVG